MLVFALVFKAKEGGRAGWVPRCDVQERKSDRVAFAARSRFGVIRKSNSA
jgi:hypothetical protein